MKWWIALLLGLLSLGVSLMGTGAIRRWAPRLGMLDVPSQRSSHERPTPRGGGMAIVAAFFLSVLLAAPIVRIYRREHLGVLVGSAAIALVGLADDRRNLSRSLRFAAWIVIAAGVMVLGVRLETLRLPFVGELSLGILGPAITFVWLIGVTNFYNFMDGIDGLAGSEALIVSVFMLIAALHYENVFVAVVCVVLAGGALGFLVYNWPPAKIFMGDGGANFLGFVFAATAIVGSRSAEDAIPLMVPVLLLGTFIFDATVTLLKRLPKGKRWLDPHRDHYYQRLIIIGYSHLQVTALYSVMSILLGSIVLLHLYLGRAATPWLLLGAMVLLVSLASLTRLLESRSASSERAEAR